MNMTRISTTQPGLLALALFLGLAVSAHADFTGQFATNRWTLFNTNADGFINLSNAPRSVTLTGGDNQSYLPGYTEWHVTVTNTTQLSFTWRYTTADDNSGPFDRAGWRLNTATNELARNDSTTLTGSVTANASTGDVFAFWVRTGDNLLGPGRLTVTNFNFSATPPHFVKSAVTNQTVVLHLQTIPGRTYRVEATPVLPATNWVQIGTNFVATNALTPLTTTTSNFPRRFFRAVLLP
jgi:hypothetical protein